MLAVTNARRAGLTAALVLGLLVPTPAQGPGPGQGPRTQAHDPEFASLVKEWTTAPEFLSPLVDHLPLAEGVPTPKAVLGYHVGAPGKLTHTADLYRYYRALAAATPRVKVTTIGKTDEGREILVVLVADEATIADAESYRARLAQLADPRGLTPEAARDVIAKAKPIYLLTGGLHSGETGPPEMLMELAYRLAVDDSPLIRSIREHVIVGIVPATEPDGRDRYVDWYNRHLSGITEERDRVSGPPYWGKYVLHDNNRDINYSQLSMRALLDWYLQWHPPIVHDLHESVPFLYTFSGQAPQNPSLDPVLYAELPWFSNFEMAQLTKYGMPGVWTHGFVDMWSPGYLAFMSSNHNGLVRMYETFGNGGATTMKRQVAPRAGEGGGGGGAGQTSREWYRPSPPYKEVTWSMRNNTNYSQTAVLTGLQLAAEFPQVVLENFYTKSRNSVESGRTQPPHGFVIPAGQRDRTRVALLVNLLRVQGIEVGRATSDVKLSDGAYPAGSYIVKRDQPYGRLAKILLEKQDFPDANLRTYDDTGWTMGLMLQAEVKATADKAVLSVAVEPVTEVQLQGTLQAERTAGTIVVPNTGSNDMVTLRWRLATLAVDAAERPFTAGGREYAAGSFVIAAKQDGRDVTAAVRSAIATLGLDAIGLPAKPQVATHAVDLPRLAVYSTWGNTQEVGWVRHALDRFGVPFDLIYKERVRQGGLRAAYDVILVPNQGRSGKGLVYDIDLKGKPLDYRRSDAFPSLGAYGESDDIRGGMGLEGVLELQRFVDGGGMLMTLGAASFFPAEFGLTRSVNAQRTSAAFYAPGPIIEAEILKPTHPIFYGYTEKKVPVRYGNGPLLQVPEADRERQVLMRYPGGAAAVLSGLMKGADELRNRPAIVEVPVGSGRVLMFAGNPCYRWQNHGEFGMLFNALMHWNDLGTASEPPAANGTRASAAEGNGAQAPAPGHGSEDPVARP